MGIWKCSMESMERLLDFYKGKTVLVTGHTGFKGSWLCHILSLAGARVIGYALMPPTSPSLFSLIDLEKRVDSFIGDIADLNSLKKVFDDYEPQIVFHLAAQPIVKASYKNPVYTYQTNVMGTVNVCECVRMSASVKSFVNITTDKVYENKEWEWGYRENDILDGYDPYSNSKSCSELVTHSYKKSYFNDLDISVSTARAGNVIGGGDFAVDRIIPDCIRAVEKEIPIVVRNPNSIRPYQHVLEPLKVYLLIAMMQYKDKAYAGNYNVGPDECDCVTTGELVDIFCEQWGSGASWINKLVSGPHEANFLKLDCSRIKRAFNWQPVWHIEEAIARTIQWTKVYLNNGDIVGCMDCQIQDFFSKEN